MAHCQSSQRSLQALLADSDHDIITRSIANIVDAICPDMGQNISAPIVAALLNGECHIIVISASAPATPPLFLPQENNQHHHMLEVGEAFAEDIPHPPTNSTINSPLVITTPAGILRPNTASSDTNVVPVHWTLLLNAPKMTKSPKMIKLMEKMVSQLLCGIAYSLPVEDRG